MGCAMRRIGRPPGCKRHAGHRGHGCPICKNERQLLYNRRNGWDLLVGEVEAKLELHPGNLGLRLLHLTFLHSVGCIDLAVDKRAGRAIEERARLLDAMRTELLELWSLWSDALMRSIGGEQSGEGSVAPTRIMG